MGNWKPQRRLNKGPLTPATPRGSTPNATDTSASTQDPQLLISPFATPPTSPSSLSFDLPPPMMPQFSTVEQILVLEPTISADDIISKDIVAIADMFAMMKKAMLMMTSTFDRFEIQTEKFASLSLDIKAAEQLGHVRKALDDQIARQKVEVEDLGDKLRTKIKEAVQEKIRTQLYDIVRASVGEKVEEKVREELSTQIPEDLRQQIVEHRRQILEVKTDLHNSEARRYNAGLRRSSATTKLRPLLRPLPTPEQSPTIIVMEDSALNSPVSALPSIRAPASTPIKRSTSNSFKGAYSFETVVPPTPSPRFPRDLKALFQLGVEEARTLLREYGLASGVSSPVTPRPRGIPVAGDGEGTSDSADANGELSDEGHVQDMNKFMAHIGVPFLMIPPPKSQEPQSPTMSPTTRRRMLRPLIISATPNIF